MLAGLWHGANWTFVAWGALHAVYLSIERLTEWPKRLSGTRFGRFASAVVTFALVCVGWAFFRAENIAQALGMLRAMVFSWHFPAAGELPDLAVWLILAGGALYETKVFCEQREGIEFREIPGTVLAIRNGILLALCVVAPGTTRSFIYFRF